MISSLIGKEPTNPMGLAFNMFIAASGVSDSIRLNDFLIGLGMDRSLNVEEEKKLRLGDVEGPALCVGYVWGEGASPLG